MPSGGGSHDFYMLYKEPEYSLPFKVVGYFRLVGCQLADGSGETFRHYYSLIFSNGEFRPETQQEARLREDGPLRGVCRNDSA